MKHAERRSSCWRARRALCMTRLHIAHILYASNNRKEEEKEEEPKREPEENKLTHQHTGLTPFSRPIEHDGSGPNY